MTVAFVDTWVPNGPFPIVYNDDVLGGFKNLPDKSNFAVGHITCVDEASITDGDTFVLDDNSNPAVTFEFDKNGSVVETPTLRAVNLAGGETAEAVAQLVIAAVNAAPTLDITASPAAGIGGLALVYDNAGSGVTITQGGTAPLFVLGMVRSTDDSVSANIATRVTAYNNIAPHNRAVNMIAGAYEDDVDQVHYVRWDGSDFQPENLVKNVGTLNLDSALDGAITFWNPEGITGSPSRLALGGNFGQQTVVLGSNAAADTASAVVTQARDSGNSPFEAAFFSGGYDDYAVDTSGIALSDLHPNFVIGEDSSAGGSADLAEIFGVTIPTPGDGTETEFHFYADEGGSPDGVVLNVDTGANAAVLYNNLTNANLFIENRATGTNNNLVLRATDTGSVVRIELGGSNDQHLRFQESGESEILAIGAADYDSGVGSISAGLPVGAGRAALAAVMDRNNSASTFNDDDGPLYVANANMTTGSFAQITFQAGDEPGSYPHGHLFVEKRTASVNVVQDFGMAISDGLGGSVDGERLFWFNAPTEMKLGGGGAGQYDGLFLFQVSLDPNTSAESCFIEMASNDGVSLGGNLAVEGDAQDNNCAWFSNRATETINPAGTSVAVAMVLSGTDALHNGGFMSFSGETGATDDDAVSTGLEGWIPDGAASGESHTSDDFDAIKVRVGSNVRWLRAYLARSPL